MAFKSWRGTVGLIKPTLRPGSFEELVRILPLGIGVVPLYLNFNQGGLEEFQDGTEPYEEPVAKLAEAGMDIIHPYGAPPFMVKGYKQEAQLIDSWEKKYKVPIFTSGTNHVAALNALKVKRFLGITYFAGDINNLFSQYFSEAGFNVVAMEGIHVPFKNVGQLSAQEVYAHIKRTFLDYRRSVQGIYLLGSGWRVLDIIQLLEEDLQVPVVHPIPARCWEIQKRLNIYQSVSGYGRLLAEML